MVSKYYLKYHIVFCTKYRKKLDDKIFSLIVNTINEFNEVEEINCDMNDHIHILVSLKPSDNISSIVKHLKMTTMNKVWSKYHDYMKLKFWKKKVLWSGGYYVSSVGDIDEEKVKKYIKNQGR